MHRYLKMAANVPKLQVPLSNAVVSAQQIYARVVGYHFLVSAVIALPFLAFHAHKNKST